MPRRVRTDLLKPRPFFKKNDMRDARKIYRLLNYLLHTKKVFPDHSDYRGLSKSSRQQKCVVKMRWGNDVSKHMRFLKEYLPQENKKEVLEKPQLFSDVPANSDFINNYETKLVDKHFKFVVAPANQNVSHEALVKVLMKRIETLTNHQLQWLAAVHTNTEHDHAHILINGIDKNGKEVDCFRGTFLKQTIREMSRQICTELIGKRTNQEIALEATKMISAPRYCKLDERIALYQRKITAEIETQYMSEVFASDEVMRQRLSYFTELGIAQKKENARRTYLLEKNWDKKLKAAGRYNSFLSARNELELTDKYNLELYATDSKAASGIITRLYKMNDEDSWNHAIVVENKGAKKAWYIPLYKEPNDKLLGATITCDIEKNQKGLLMPKIKVLSWNIKR